jgi:two-component system phosphate regulon sensor histidine kinase PhoR
MDFFLGFVAMVAGIVALRSHLLLRRRLRLLGEAVRSLREGRLPRSLQDETAPVMRDLGQEIDSIYQEIREMRNKAQDNDRLLQSVLGTMSDAIMTVDSRHIIRRVNKEFMALFHLQRDPVGMTVLEALREAEIEVAIRDTFRAREQQSLELSVRDFKAVEGFRQIQLRSMPLMDAEGHTLGVLAAFHDVSPLRKIERSRREFVANVSHELRTPLAVISGYVEMLLSSQSMLKPERTKIYQTMQRHAQRLKLLLEDLLQLSRMESRRFNLRLQPLELKPFFERVIEDWTLLASEKKIVLQLEIEDSTGTVEVDSHRLEQALTNLLENSLKYSQPEQRVVLAVRRQNPVWTLSVMDFGSGIPPQDLPHVFEPFYRVDKARARDQGGTGLGLAIVKQIVESHGGSVRASSEIGHGTTMLLTFPVNAPEETETKEASVKPAQIN